MHSPPPPAWYSPPSPQWPIKNHRTMHCMSRQWAQLSALVPAVNPLGWILLVLPLPLMESEVGPHPGRVRTKSLNDAHHVRKPFPWWTLRPLRNMVPAHLRKVMMMVIKGVYHGCFAVTSCIHFWLFPNNSSDFP